MDDLISRAAAIEAILAIKDYGNSDRANALGLAECAITTLPSAQPEIEERKGKSAQNVPKEDLISRRAAIEALDSINCCGYVEEPWDIVRGIIERVPAAESEKRTEERAETHACDCISRQLALDVMNGRFETLKQAWGNEIKKDGVSVYLDMRGIIEALPSAQPEIVRCKECKYWKDSDGVYRRGFDAESKCPLNLKKVYEGTFYCGMAERRNR